MSLFRGDSTNILKKGLPVKNDEESCFVAGSGEISNFELVKDLAKVVDYLSNEIGDEFLLKY